MKNSFEGLTAANILVPCLLLSSAVSVCFQIARCILCCNTTSVCWDYTVMLRFHIQPSQPGWGERWKWNLDRHGVVHLSKQLFSFVSLPQIVLFSRLYTLHFGAVRWTAAVNIKHLHGPLYSNTQVRIWTISLRYGAVFVCTNTFFSPIG